MYMAIISSLMQMYYIRPRVPELGTAGANLVPQISRKNASKSKRHIVVLIILRTSDFNYLVYKVITSLLPRFSK